MSATEWPDLEAGEIARLRELYPLRPPPRSLGRGKVWEHAPRIERIEADVSAKAPEEKTPGIPLVMRDSHAIGQQGRQDSNLQPPVLESDPNRPSQAHPRIHATLRPVRSRESS
jgi:hypothetical protein